jgi:hypothetical protein
MESQSHIHAPEIVSAKFDSVAKFWSALSEEEREYVGSVRLAIKEQIEWKLPIQSID